LPRVVLLSTYDLGRQPFGLASPAAWLEAEGCAVTLLDLAVAPPDEAALSAADLIGFYLPMHTATRLAVPHIRRARALSPKAHLCAFGLYAPLNEKLLRERGVDSVIGGEFEEPLSRIARWLGGRPTQPDARTISLVKQSFKPPSRGGLPALSEYAKLTMPDGSRKHVGSTEATRGCKHRCRHCPVVPVYDGRFFIVQRDIVLADIGQQVAAGASHISFGDPDFFNGIGHALALVDAFHRDFPDVTYDVTIKIEHLVKHLDVLATLRDTGCLFVTSAVESVDDRTLARLDKGHTRADFIRVSQAFRAVGLVLCPTFVAFSPWLTLDGYRDLLETIEELGLVENVAPVQLAIRLLITSGSRLLELAEIRDLVGPFDAELLCYPWSHPDPRVDALHAEVNDIVQSATASVSSRTEVFEQIRNLVETGQRPDRTECCVAPTPPTPSPPLIPQMSEPWYCCAEPTIRQRDAF
jgi:radical SAM superfamily enzyme YgiQ (UPF0313 family)